MFGNISERRRKLSVHLEAPWSPSNKPGSADHKPESTNNKPGSPGNMSGSTSNHSRAVWENNIFFGNAAGVPGTHSYYLSFNDF